VAFAIRDYLRRISYWGDRMRVGDIVMLHPKLFYDNDEAVGIVVEIDAECKHCKLIYVCWPNNSNGKQQSWFKPDELMVIDDKGAEDE
jgi:hypothetical protein